MRTGQRRPTRVGSGAQVIDTGPLGAVLGARQEPQPSHAERRLAAILRFLPVVVFSLDSEGLIASVSEVGVDMIEASSAKVVGRSVFELFSDPRICREMRRALAGHQVTGMHPGPAGHYFRTRLDPMFDPDGNLRGIMGVSVDVTGAWLDKQQLRQLHRLRLERGRLLKRVIRARIEEPPAVTSGRDNDSIEDLLGAATPASWVSRHRADISPPAPTFCKGEQDIG